MKLYLNTRMIYYMNKLTQFGIILLMLLDGQITKEYFNLTIPSTIIGMMLLLLLLILKIIKVSWIEGVSKVLLDNLSLFFIPAGVSIMNELDIFKGKVISLLFILLISTIVVMVVTAYTVQILMAIKDK